MNTLTGGDVLCAVLEELGAQCIFGLPGTQNVEFFESLRRSSIRTVLATSELAAAFMANGYYRASGRPGVLTTISGPGFAYALAGLAEAAQDSAAIVYIVGARQVIPGKKFNLQEIDQIGIARRLLKCVYEVSKVAELAPMLRKAFAAAMSGEPGPVMLQVAQEVFSRTVPQNWNSEGEAARGPSGDVVSTELIRQVVGELARAGRILIFAGQGTNAAADQLRELAELLQSPVVATRSARGVLPEDHPLSIAFSYTEGIGAVNSLLDRSDVILAIGCKFSHNGTFGFRFRIPQEKLIHVDACPEVLGANYPTHLQLCCDAGIFINAVLNQKGMLSDRVSSWTAEEVDLVRNSLSSEKSLEPNIQGVNPPTAATFFAALRHAIPGESCVVTDSGLHQVMTTRHFKVLQPRGMVIPSDFQSMGFGLPAAVGAKLARPERTVIAIIGDGGLAMSGMELLTAVREKIRLTVIVFNDGALGEIRLQQWQSYGSTHATELTNPDLALFAAAIGAKYAALSGDPEKTFRDAFESDGVTLIEVGVSDSQQMKIQRAKGYARRTGKALLPEQVINWLKSKVH